jgi:predicted ArsR family transcriptional regulator
MRNTDALTAAAAINDPVRRRLLELVAASAHPLTRDAAAQATALPRSTVSFHLDRLVDAGLLTVEYRRVSGKAGPGSGRPSKIYSRASGEFSVSIPPRHYDLMGGVFAAAIELASESETSVFDALRTVARNEGRAVGAEAGSLDAVLEDTGYEPRGDGRDISLANCPFHSLVEKHTEVVCSANHAFLCGAAEATGGDADSVVLDPGPGRCCVRIVG